jgi:nucleoid-associated protein YgaU
MNRDSQIGVIVGTIIATAFLVFVTKQSQEDSFVPINTEYPTEQLSPAEPSAILPHPFLSKETGETQIDVHDAREQAAAKRDPEVLAEKILAPIIVKVEKPKKRYYTVKAGDNLYIISSRYYGSGQFVKHIFEANIKSMGSPDHLVPGMQLEIPHPKDIMAKH